MRIYREPVDPSHSSAQVQQHTQVHPNEGQDTNQQRPSQGSHLQDPMRMWPRVHWRNIKKYS